MFSHSSPHSNQDRMCTSVHEFANMLQKPWLCLFIWCVLMSLRRRSYWLTIFLYPLSLLLFRWVKQEIEISKTAQLGDTGPKLDLGFKEGQTITLNIGVKKGIETSHLVRGSSCINVPEVEKYSTSVSVVVLPMCLSLFFWI